MSRKRAWFLAWAAAWTTGLAALNLSAARRGADHDVFDPLVDVCNLVQQHYVRAVAEKELAAGAINGMLHQLDPYSEYIPAEEVDEFAKQTSGAYEGIGIGIDLEDGVLTVISPFEGSPAYQAGVLPGDRIVEVEGRSTKGWSATQAVQEMTGPAGTSVRLKLLRSDGTEQTVTIERREIHVPTVRGWRRDAAGGWAYLLDAKAGIGYVRVNQFTEDTPGELDGAVEELRRGNLAALILDLRANPGGILSAAAAVCDRFLDDGVIVSTRGAHGPGQEERAKAGDEYGQFPLVVLVDEGSASASEIVAGALQDHHRAVIVGERTWGKGSVQRLIRLPESGAVLKLTTDYYYLPGGRCVHRLPEAQEWGVDPDVEQGLARETLTGLRALMVRLARPGGPGREGEEPNRPMGARPATGGSGKGGGGPEELARQLLELDGQLAEAVKQCRGLQRVQPSLAGLAEAAPTGGPEAEAGQPEGTNELRPEELIPGVN